MRSIASDGAPAAVLGISADYHDAAAALVVDGVVVGAVAEERFTRRKHDPAMPAHAVAWCLEDAGLEPGDLDLVAFYSKPLTAYERILATHATVGPVGFPSLARAVSSWSTRKLWVGYRIERLLTDLGHRRVPIVYAEHHVSHAAAAFFPSPFEEAAVITVDGVGEWATSSIGTGRGARVELAETMTFPDSLGLFYSTMTALCGFEVNDGEYKLMGLAPYGEPRYADLLKERVVRIGPHGDVTLDQRWFAYRAGRRMARPRLEDLLGGPPPPPGEPPGPRQADIAASAQVVLEDALLAIARRAHRTTGLDRACLAGGVALNCVANRRLLDEGPFADVWIQPAAGDDGSAVGAALWGWHHHLDRPRPAPAAAVDGMSGALLGPRFDGAEVAAWLAAEGVPHTQPDDLVDLVAAALADGALVGWFSGRMEFGPRALGSRSILADPRDPDAVSRLNRAVKGREGFRPVAPAVLAEHADEWFELDRPSPYMLLTAPVHPDRRVAAPTPSPDAPWSEQLAVARSTIPACTHVDLSARVQTVDRATHPTFHALLSAFHRLTGCPVLVNTSFNRAGEPIVRSPADALRTFRATALDLLAVEGCLVPADGAAPIAAAAARRATP